MTEILEEILALGGTREDYELIEDVLSEDEKSSSIKEKESVPEKPQKKVKEIDVLAQLKKFMKKEKITEDSFKSIYQDSDDDESVTDEQEVKENVSKSKEKEVKEKAKEKEVKAKEMKKNKEKEEMEKQEKLKEIKDKELQAKKVTQSELKEVKEPKVKDEKKAKRLFLEPGSVWYEELPSTTSSSSTTASVISEKQISALYEKARSIYENECALYAESVKKTSANKEFMQTLLKAGTTTDRVSALTLLIQESPFHTLNYLDNNLIQGMAMKNSKREALLAIDSVKDLLVNTIMPERKLVYFRDQSINDINNQQSNTSQKQLALWYFEDSLKRLYFQFTQILEDCSKDPLFHIKNKVLIYLHELFCLKSEQEQNVLTLIVNKLGDQDKKIASKVVFLLLKTLESHPNMKLILVKEVEKILFRPNVQKRAQYYAITFLNQIPLSKSEVDSKTANALISIYFSLFEQFVKQIRDEKYPENNKSKPTKNGNFKKGNKHFKNKPFKKNIPIEPKEMADGIENKMLGALLTGVNRAFPYASIDDEVYAFSHQFNRFDRQMNTLFTIAHLGSFNTCVQALVLIFHVQDIKQAISDRFYRVLYSSLLDERLIAYSKQSLYLNLLYKSLKADISLNRVMAFIKRIIQMCHYFHVPLSCASLFLVSEICKAHPGCWSLMDPNDGDDEEEVFKDMDDDDEIVKNINEDDVIENSDKPLLGPSNLHGSDKNSYDGLKREPLYANANRTSLYELLPLTNHFHPSIAFYSKSLISKQPIPIPKSAVNYDPLQNHTLTRFLDRFVYKNPKHVESFYKGTSIMQPRPMKSDDMLVLGGRKRNIQTKNEGNGIQSYEDSAVNILNVKTEDVPVDELFFHNFFKTRPVNQDKEKKISGDLSDEDEIWGAIMTDTKMPRELDPSDEDEEFPFNDDFGDDDSDTDEENEASDDQLPGHEENEQDDDEVEMMNEFQDPFGQGDVSSGDEMEELGKMDPEDAPPTDKVSVKKNKKKLEEKAKSFGYKGDFFTERGVFASADDFQNLMKSDDENDSNIAEDETPEDENSNNEEPIVQKKRKMSIKKQKFSKRVRK